MTIDLDGYQRIAQCVTDDGCIMLLSDNSTRYLLVRCFVTTDPFDRLPVSGELLEQFGYGQNTMTAFSAAFTAMHVEVMRRSRSLLDIEGCVMQAVRGTACCKPRARSQRRAEGARHDHP